MPSYTTETIPGEDAAHYKSNRQKRKQGSPKMQPPLTPMIDVTFQLLLFFLLTCQFRVAEGQIPGSLPAKGAPASVQQPDLKEIRISVRPGMDADTVGFFIDNEQAGTTEPRALYEQLIARQQRLGDPELIREKVPVMIEPVDVVPWEFVVEAFNQAVRAKFKHIGFASR